MVNILWFLGALVLLWIGSGFLVKAITNISHRLHMSPFFVSFFFLGFFTSISEISVGITAVFNNEPEIYVGNMVGGSVVLFLLVIPSLAFFGNGISLNHAFSFKDLVFSTVVVGLPSILTLDNSISLIDAIVCVLIWATFVYMMGKKNRTIDKITQFVHFDNSHTSMLPNLINIVFGVALILIGSNILVRNTVAIGDLLHIDPFVISILIISLGTNIPEITVAVRSIVAKKKDIAFGNYVGSATLNTLEMGILSFFSKTPVPANGSNYSVTLFILGLILFVYFVKSKNSISRLEGSLILCSYVIFVFCEIFTGPGWKI